MTELIATWHHMSLMIYVIIFENFPNIILLAQRTCLKMYFYEIKYFPIAGPHKRNISFVGVYCILNVYKLLKNDPEISVLLVFIAYLMYISF